MSDRCPLGYLFAYAKTKTQISFAVTAKLINAFVFAIRIVQSLYYLHPKFQASSHFLWLYRPVCVGPGKKPRIPVFSQRGSLEFLSCHVTPRCCALGQWSTSYFTWNWHVDRLCKDDKPFSVIFSLFAV